MLPFKSKNNQMSATSFDLLCRERLVDATETSFLLALIKTMPRLLKHLFPSGVVFHDAIMYQGNSFAGIKMGMGILFR